MEIKHDPETIKQDIELLERLNGTYDSMDSPDYFAALHRVTAYARWVAFPEGEQVIQEGSPIIAL